MISPAQRQALRLVAFSATIVALFSGSMVRTTLAHAQTSALDGASIEPLWKTPTAVATSTSVPTNTPTEAPTATTVPTSTPTEVLTATPTATPPLRDTLTPTPTSTRPPEDDDTPVPTDVPTTISSTVTSVPTATPTTVPPTTAPTTAPPEAQPPVSQPPVSQPPVSQPPVSQPPARNQIVAGASDEVAEEAAVVPAVLPETGSGDVYVWLMLLIGSALIALGSTLRLWRTRR